MSLRSTLAEGSPGRRGRLLGDVSSVPVGWTGLVWAAERGPVTTPGLEPGTSRPQRVRPGETQAVLGGVWRWGACGLRRAKTWGAGPPAAACLGEKNIFHLWSRVRKEAGLCARNWGRGERKGTKQRRGGSKQRMWGGKRYTFWGAAPWFQSGEGSGPDLRALGADVRLPFQRCRPALPADTER